MKTTASKGSANKTAKRANALKELLGKQESNLLEIKEDLPFGRADQAVNMRTVQFGDEVNILKVGNPPNLSEAIGIFHELIAKEISSAASHLEINELELG